MMEEIISKVRKNPTNYKRAPDSIVRVTLIVDLEGFSLADITYKPGRLFVGDLTKSALQLSLSLFYRSRSGVSAHSVTGSKLS